MGFFKASQITTQDNTRNTEAQLTMYINQTPFDGYLL